MDLRDVCQFYFFRLESTVLDPAETYHTGKCYLKVQNAACASFASARAVQRPLLKCLSRHLTQILVLGATC
eukprot:6208588-Pleurochrysis_carterae.AAC.2